jgi:hypothetical protein
MIPSALYDDPRVAAESSCRRRSASTSFPAVISKDVDGGPPPAIPITTNRRVNDFDVWYKTTPREQEAGMGPADILRVGGEVRRHECHRCQAMEADGGRERAMPDTVMLKL